MINGVSVKKLKRHSDERGSFTELIRKTDTFFNQFGQWSESVMWQGTIKAWHYHKEQIDYWRVSFGVVKAVLCDIREGSSTYLEVSEYLMGDGYGSFVLKIPPGVAHGLKVVQGPAILSYITSEIYNPEEELRLPYDDPAIGYDWHKEDIR